MKKKSTKKVTKHLLKSEVKSESASVREIKHYIGIVTENFQDRLSAVLEQFPGLHEKVDRIEHATNEHTEILKSHERILRAHTLMHESHSRKLESQADMIGRLMIDAEEIKIGMREKISREEFNKLESRLVSLESFVFSGGKKNTSKSSK